MSNQVIVIGGGVIGLVCALRLRQTGLEVLLLDAGGAAPPASFGNAGHIAIEQTRPLASPESLRSAPGRLFARGGALDFRLSDVRAWGPWAARYLRSSTAKQADAGSQALRGLLGLAMPAWRRLAADVGAPELLIENGHLVVWESDATANAGLAHWIKADTGAAHIEAMTPLQIEDLARRLDCSLSGGVRIENTGQISDPSVMMAALARRFDELGGVRRTARVTGLDRAGQGVSIVLADGETLMGDRVVVASGVGSGALMEGLGYVSPVIAERGYHVEGALTDGKTHWHSSTPVVFEDRSMIVTRFGDRLRVSSFVEFGREESPPAPRKWARLRKHISELGLPITEPFSEWMGARPTLPDYLPAIGMGEGGLVYAFGHQHLGLTLAAVTGELVADLVTGRDSAVSLQPFDLGRFAKRRPRTLEMRS